MKLDEAKKILKDFYEKEGNHKLYEFLCNYDFTKTELHSQFNVIENEMHYKGELLNYFILSDAEGNMFKLEIVHDSYDTPEVDWAIDLLKQVTKQTRIIQVYE